MDLGDGYVSKRHTALCLSAGVPAMQVKAHYEGIAEGLMAASPAGGSLGSDAIAALQAASSSKAAFEVVQPRSVQLAMTVWSHVEITVILHL